MKHFSYIFFGSARSFCARAPGEYDDDDKVRGRGGYFTIKEWKRILCFLTKHYKVKMIQPLKCSIDKEKFENVISKLRQVDCICFSVEMKEKNE